jgi:hypothetical protein
MLIRWNGNHKFDREFLFVFFPSFHYLNFSIHFAITNGDEIMYDLLEQSGALIESILTDGDNSLLHWFCYRKENDRKLSLLQKLLDKGCDINAQNRDKLTPLMIAAKSNMMDTCRVLLENRADMDKRDSGGNQAIDFTIPGSDCSKLFLQEKNIRVSPSNKKVLWRKRIESTRQVASDINDDTLSPKEEMDLTNTYMSNTTRKRYSEQYSHKPENMWNKFLQGSPKRKVLKTFYDKRAHSAETRNRPKC